MIEISISLPGNPKLYEFYEEVILAGQVPPAELAKWMDGDPAFAEWLRQRDEFRQPREQRSGGGGRPEQSSGPAAPPPTSLAHLDMLDAARSRGGSDSTEGDKS
jgi:hypothetical protein